MKKTNLEQGSKAWLSWRKTVITATDCPAILGSSPWSTEFKCWQKKLGLIEEEKSNEAMERGKKLEPIIRERFIRKYGINMTPIVIESSEYEFLGASLDGLSDCDNYILEIKTGGHKLHKMAEDGIIPEYYMHQMQHQLLVTGAQKCFYQVGGEDKTKDIVIEVYPNPNFANLFMPKAREFWKNVAFMEAPPLADSDYKNMNENDACKKYAQIYQETDAEIKLLEKKKDFFRNELINICGDQNCIVSGMKIMKVITKGRVDYDQIPEIKDIDLDKYRKNPTTSWKILVEKKS
jgi:putative phage-type endonuclease